MKANDLVKSLEGKWDNFGIGICDGEPVARENFTEILTIKGEHTLSIRCEGFSEGVVSASEWRIELIGDKVSMDQGS